MQVGCVERESWRHATVSCRPYQSDYTAGGRVSQVTRALAAVPFASADVERLPDEEETEEWQPLVCPGIWSKPNCVLRTP